MNQTNTTSIMLVGVGGQGVLTAAEIIAQACRHEGYDVKKSEVHGMAQRGGSVVSHVRYARDGQVAAPLPAREHVDLLVGFELLETVRALDWLKPGESVVANMLLLIPPLAAGGAVPGREECVARIAEQAGRVVRVEGEELARQAGNVRTANTAVIGAAAALLPISLASWRQAVAEVVPAGTEQVNWQAFELGQAMTLSNEG